MSNRKEQRRIAVLIALIGTLFLFASTSALAQLDDWRSLVRQLYGDSVLHLTVKGVQDGGGLAIWEGTGFIVQPRGFVITAAHVVQGDGVYQRREITARTRSKKDGKSWTMQIIKVDSDLDVALLKLPDPVDSGIRWIPVPISDSNALRPDEEVVALGFSNDINTDGLESYKGTVSSAMQRYGWFPVSNTAFNPGNSGGPVFGRDLQVVGWVVGGRRDELQKNYIVPINFARGVLSIGGVIPSH